MRKCRWSSTRHDAVVLTGEFWGFVSVLTATSNVVLCVCLPAPVQFLQSFFPKCQAFHVIVFALLSFSYDSSSSSQYFLHAGSFNPRWCFKAGEGDEQRSPPIRRESRVEEAGTYVTDDESIGQSVCQSVCLTPNQGDFKLLQKDVLVVPQTADTCSSSVEREDSEGHNESLHVVCRQSSSLKAATRNFHFFMIQAEFSSPQPSWKILFNFTTCPKQISQNQIRWQAFKKNYSNYIEISSWCSFVCQIERGIKVPCSLYKWK